jgi:asparagine synthase (glutamine-hydrolysing)
MISDVPLGAFLSGGIDSSLVVSIMQEMASTPVKTFTIGFHDEDYDEASTARLIADTLGTEHTERYLKEENAYSIVPELASIFDEPFADASQIPTILVSKLARQDVTVALSGDGGDELMGGYSRHLFANKLWSLNNKLPDVLRSLIPVNSISKNELNIQYLYDKISNTGLISKKHRQFGNKVAKATSALTAKDEKELYALLLKNKLDENKLFSNLLKENSQCGDSFNFSGINGNLSMIQKMMFWDVKNYMMDDVLVKVDRATMSTSLEARSPLLDYRLFEYVWSLPIQYLVNGEEGGKLLMKSLLEDYLPQEVLNQPKSGFRIPIGQWLKGPLKSWAEKLIYSNNGSYQYINKNYVESIWHDHLNGKGNWEDELWTIMMFQSWYKKFLS